MPQTNNEHRSSFSWAPFTIDHLFQKHGLKRVRTVALLSLWISLVAVSMVSVFFMMSGSWVDGNLDQSAINNYFMLYPPLIIGTLLLFWLGFEWGFIPVFLATFVIAFGSDMPFYWAMLFAFAFVLGLGIYALSYYCVSLDKSLRDLKSFAFFVVISFVASIASSLGAFIWSFAHDMSVTQSMILWRGWWTGVLLQSVFIIAPILFLLTPYIEKVKTRWFETPEPHEVTLNWIYGAILTVSVVLGLFIIGANSLGTQMIESLTVGMDASATDQFLQATDSYQIITGISITLILGLGLGGIYLVGSWNSSLQEEVDLKTAELQKSKNQLKESLQEKEQLLEAIHDRMRSNLTIMLALLEIQLKNKGQKSMDDVLRESYSRLRSLAIVHETMYHTKSLDSLNIKLYAIKLFNRLDHSKKYRKNQIQSIINASDIFINLDRAIPMAMVLNELIINTYQHAFDIGVKGTLRLNMKIDSENELLKIEVSDTGRGLPKNIKEFEKKHLGLKLSRLLIEQLHGSMEIIDPEKSLFQIKIPLEGKEMEKFSQENPDIIDEELIPLHVEQRN